MDTTVELYACTVCMNEYDSFVDAIWCCEDVDKHGENYFAVEHQASSLDWSDIT